MVIQSRFNFQDCDKHNPYLIDYYKDQISQERNPVPDYPKVTKRFKEGLTDEVVRDNYCEWLSGKGFTHFLTLTYRDAPAYNKKGEPWGGPPSFSWIKKSINYLNSLSHGYCSPAFIVIERGKNPPNLLGLSVPKGMKVKDAELREWESSAKGRLHLHGMMATVPRYASFFSARWQQKYGYNSIVPMRSAESAAEYCTKYVMKELNNPEFIDNVSHLGEWGDLHGGDES